MTMVQEGQTDLLAMEHSSALKYREERLCVVCMVHEKKVLLLPCKHLCMCKACTDKIVTGSARCPVCRELVADSVEAFF